MIKFDRDKTDNVINIDIGSKESMVVEVDGEKVDQKKRTVKTQVQKGSLRLYSHSHI